MSIGILGIDPGEKRIGIAIAHQGLTVATGLCVLERTPKLQFFEKLTRIIAEENIGLIIMGLPLNMDGSEGDSAKKARSLAEKIKKEFDVEVEFEDERLTTDQALKLMRTTGSKVGKDKGRIDMLAAVNILQSYLDRQS